MNEKLSSRKVRSANATDAPASKRMVGKFPNPKLVKSANAPQRQKAPKKFITSTQKWKERKELKKRLQVKLTKNSDSSKVAQATVMNQNDDQKVEERSESGRYHAGKGGRGRAKSVLDQPWAHICILPQPLVVSRTDFHTCAAAGRG